MIGKFLGVHYWFFQKATQKNGELTNKEFLESIR